MSSYDAHPAPLPSATEVLIVGAGPTGLVLACVLKAQGVDVVILDAEPRRGRESSRATTVHAATLEMLDRLEVGATLAEAGTQSGRSNVWFGRQLLTTSEWHSLPSRYPFMLNVPQQETETILLDRYSVLGGSVFWGCTLDRIAESNGQVDATIRDGQEHQKMISARFLLGCDGAHSVVRRNLNLKLEGKTYPELFLLADVEMADSLPNDETNLFVSDEGPFGLLPLPGGQIRFNAVVEREFEPTREHISVLMKRRARGREFELKTVRASSFYRVHRRIARQYRVGNVFLAGDAAHVNSPIGGQGMNLGMHDAFNLGWKLGLIIRHGAHDSMLDSFDTERRPEAVRALEGTDRATRLFAAKGAIGRGVANTILRIGTRVGIAERMTLQLSGLATAYRGSPIVADLDRRRRAPLPGDRISASGDGLSHILIISGSEGVREAVEALIARTSMPISMRVTDREACDADLPTFTLVRPDGHIAWMGGATELDKASIFLHRTVGCIRKHAAA